MSKKARDAVVSIPRAKSPTLEYCGAKYERQYKKHEEDKEEHLRDRSCTCGDTTKSEDCRNQGDDQEYYCPA